jgi:hypothetical protein
MEELDKNAEKTVFSFCYGGNQKFGSKGRTGKEKI